MASSIDVGAGIVCDEVRREDNGKLILIGAYSANIVVAALPAALVLSLVLKVEATEAGESALEFRVKLEGQQLRAGKGRVRIGAGVPQWVVVPSILLDKITTEGRLEFEVRIGEGDWKTACWLPLSLRQQPSAASAPQRPS